MKITSQYLKQLREDYINSIMNNDTLTINNNSSKILVFTKGDNEEYVQLLETPEYYEVKASWRIKGQFDNLGNAKRLYKSLVDELLEEF